MKMAAATVAAARAARAAAAAAVRVKAAAATATAVPEALEVAGMVEPDGCHNLRSRDRVHNSSHASLDRHRRTGRRSPWRLDLWCDTNTQHECEENARGREKSVARSILTG